MQENDQRIVQRVKEQLPVTWEVLDRTEMPQDLWNAVNKESNYVYIAAHVNIMEDAAYAIAILLGISTEQAALIMTETLLHRIS